VSTHDPNSGPPLLNQPPPTALGIGSVLADRYRVTGVLGEGGMGSVYLAEHVALGKQVALKVLKPELVDEPSLVERFFREARATAAIQHDNVVEILDFGETEQFAFFAMEALQGCELADVIGEGQRISWTRAKPIIVQIARALAAAHRQGVVHRDMKPGNVFLTRRSNMTDFVKVLDFGIAKIDDGRKLTRAGMVFGTAAYMAPEQASGGEVDGRTDMYALGCMIYEMLTGWVPFPGDQFMQVIADHIRKPAPRLRDAGVALAVPPEVLDPLEALLARTLEKFPDPRFPDMDALERAVLELPGEMPAALHQGAPLPPALLGSAHPARASNHSQAQPTAQTQIIPGMGGAEVQDLERGALAPIAYLFVAFAKGTDGVLTNSEMRTLADRLRRWAPQVGLDGVGQVLREAVQAYRDDVARGGVEAKLLEVREALAADYAPAARTQLVADLRAIAEADGRLQDTEQQFLAVTARVFGLEGDRRLDALALLFLTLSAVTEGTVAATEMRVLGARLRQWAPGSSTAEAGAALRSAVDEYKQLREPEARLRRAGEAAETLRSSTDADSLRRILADLWRIAGADGVISPAEQQFIMDMVQRFGV